MLTQATLTEKNGLAIWSGVMPAGAPSGIDPLRLARGLVGPGVGQGHHHCRKPPANG